MRLEGYATIHRDLVSEANCLSVGEVVHACVIGVVHVVVNGIKTRSRASVTVDRTTKRRLRLSGSIVDVVTRAIAPILERVVESNPVTGLVCQGATQICRSSGTPGERSEIYDDNVVLGVATVVGREGSVAEETLCGGIVESDGEDVESVGTATPEGRLHLRLFRGLWASIIKPLSIDDPGDVGKFELKASSTVIPVHDVDLIRDLLIRNGTLRKLSPRRDYVEINRDRVVGKVVCNPGGALDF